jgi:methylmalonyl-CoA/ethylmalonyl-CoA epimerase
VDDIEGVLGKLKEAGIEMIDSEPRVGIRQSRVAFVHPRSTGGVLTEIVEPAEGH